MNKEVQAYTFLLNCFEKAHNALMSSGTVDEDESRTIVAIQGLIKKLINNNMGNSQPEQQQPQPQQPVNPMGGPTQVNPRQQAILDGAQGGVI